MSSRTFTAFAETTVLAKGSLDEVTKAVRGHAGQERALPVLVFEDGTGRIVDLDLRAETERQAPSGAEEAGPPRRRGRPKLGVVAREVTLLPRHWDWLAAQPGGASAALRRLVDQARKADGDATAVRQAQEAAYRFMSAIAGDLPGFEEACRALFSGDIQRLSECVSAWPEDIATYALGLARGTDAPNRK